MGGGRGGLSPHFGNGGGGAELPHITTCPYYNFIVKHTKDQSLLSLRTKNQVCMCTLGAPLFLVFPTPHLLYILCFSVATLPFRDKFEINNQSSSPVHCLYTDSTAFECATYWQGTN